MLPTTATRTHMQSPTPTMNAERLPFFATPVRVAAAPAACPAAPVRPVGTRIALGTTTGNPRPWRRLALEFDNAAATAAASNDTNRS